LIIPLERRAEEDDVLAHLRRGEKIDHFETERQTKDGRRLNISLTVSPIKDSTGRIIGASKVARDITERKRSEEQLLEAKREAEAASHAKDKFLAALSHELRTPLTPVLMTVAAMDINSDLAPELRDDIAMIRRNVELEAKLIDDLLDLSLALSGKLRLDLETVEVNEVVHHVCEICRPFVLEKRINLHCDLPDPSPFVKADPARLQQVLWNLLRNATKFTPERGDISVIVSPTTENRVRLQVRDSGIGIAPDVLPYIFDAFEQGDADITREFGGMGLGLAITKNLVELHRGTIRAESGGAKQGSTFTLEFPLVSKKVDEQARPAESASASGEALRILFVDDNDDTAFVLSKFLTASGYLVKTAGSAVAALELASKEPFDIMVSDIGLPDVNGYELMKQIRAFYPIQGIAMSGYGMEDDLRKSREAGFSDHIVKPASLSQLERSIHRLRRNVVEKQIATT
jgi:two-component system CheB/CheR fusion protein